MLPRAQGASTVSKRAAHTGKNCCQFTGHSSADGRAFLVDHLFPSFIGPSHQIEAVCVARAHKRKSIRLFFRYTSWHRQEEMVYRPSLAIQKGRTEKRKKVSGVDYHRNGCARVFRTGTKPIS